MFSVVDLLVIAASHWFADFVLQRSRDAVTKCEDNRALGRHVGSYALGMIPCGIYLVGWSQSALLWLPVTFALHFATDYVTSRVGHRFKAQERMKAYFTTLGFDQFLHFAALVLTTAALRA